MGEVLAVAYAIGWLLTSLGVYAASRRLCADCPRPDHPVLVSILAGLVWPFVLLGVIEVGALAVTGKAAADSGPQLSVLT
jgi:hypothetical protein